jgi:hypothetical protein
MKDEDIYIVRKELVIAVYEMIGAQDKFIQEHREEEIKKANEPSKEADEQDGNGTSNTNP